ncbi:hypothetical protein BCY91_17165 [Pelobium manganitolerans]|uniref:Uncharacterized protein n=1 Tax=Pelobium manganitolerans TaxID=1842495 RepID=A0A419S6B3_9SPHI|nr:hypothetical protein [Pelobium manganitolerans]RKD16584.1 hypothetical protein BCY91_17165 [Pelobium manganitolerans]
MRLLSSIVAIVIFIISSCDSPKNKVLTDKKISIIGKWHRFTLENGYTEFCIDSQYVVFYNQKVGRFQLKYKIENDSLKYLTKQYAAKITNYGDSVYLEGNDSTTATLYKFKEPNTPFNLIPNVKDSLSFALYLKGFDKRLAHEFEKAGIAISDNTGLPPDTIYQQLLKKRSH